MLPLISSLISSLTTPLARHRFVLPFRPDAGMSTAEYAVGTVTACAFAALLYAILTSSEVQDTLTSMVNDALQLAG